MIEPLITDQPPHIDHQTPLDALANVGDAGKVNAIADLEDAIADWSKEFTVMVTDRYHHVGSTQRQARNDGKVDPL